MWVLRMDAGRTIPARVPHRLGGPRVVALRTVVKCCALHGFERVCQWAADPQGSFAPYTTVQGYFYRWSRDGTWGSHQPTRWSRLVARRRSAAKASPSAGCHRQPIGQDHGRAAGREGLRCRKKKSLPRRRPGSKARKRHIVTDTEGHLVGPPGSSGRHSGSRRRDWAC